MKVLHVNNVDLVGRRFSGYDLIEDLGARGIESSQAVLTKLSDNPAVISLLDGPEDEALNEALQRVEQRHSMDNVLFPWGRILANLPQFHEADVIHYHLIHNSVISLVDLPWLTLKKPSVWTFHDPWPLTGHCIQPMECEGWISDCTPCLHLDRFFAMAQDCAGSMWRLKRHVYSHVDVDVIVASQFMMDMIQRSPLGTEFERVHLVPFGVRPDFLPADYERDTNRSMLGIPADDFVVFFRAEEWEVKGLRELIIALQSSPPSRPTTLLAVGTQGLLDALRPQYNIVDLGWVNAPDLYPRLFSASDVFVMPSLAEAFGLMAVEAMAAGRPVICFEGTPLPCITYAPKCGLAVPHGDPIALRGAIDAIASDPVDAHRRGELARRLAESVYSHELYLDRLASIYEMASVRAD